MGKLFSVIIFCIGVDLILSAFEKEEALAQEVTAKAGNKKKVVKNVETKEQKQAADPNRPAATSGSRPGKKSRGNAGNS